MPEFCWPVRVYYEDTDNGGVVYYANYLKFMERARTEWLRAQGVEQDVLSRREGIIFAVRSANVEFKKPARFNQLLEVSVRIIKRGGASISFQQEVRDAGSDKEVLCSAEIKIACLDVQSFRPKAIPDSMNREKICEF